MDDLVERLEKSTVVTYGCDKAGNLKVDTRP